MAMTFAKASVALGLALAVQAASADYLYWMVENANDGTGPVSFDYARVSTDDGQTYCNLYVLSGDDAVALNGYGGDPKKLQSDPSDGTSSIGGVGVYADLGVGFNDLYSTFLFELMLGDDLVGMKEYQYAALANYIVRTGDAMAQSADEPFVLNRVIPEPSGALLLLVGFAGLALRRRRI